jgi:hypothetical protein
MTIKTSRDEDAKAPAIDGVSVEASLWILLPKAAFGIALSMVVVLLRFWGEFGYVSMFAVGFAVFIAAFEVLLIVGFRFADRPDVHTTVKARNDVFDHLGAWWLMACAFGAFFGWIVGNLAVLLPDQWRVVMVVKVFFTIVVPVATMLPNLRYITRNSAYVQVPLLFFVTLLSILVGVGALISLFTGVRP